MVMYNQNPQQIYQQNSIQTAAPEKLVLMLYDGLIKFLTQAKDAIEGKNMQVANNNILRSQDIVMELISGINQEAGEISENLTALYDFMYRKLIVANIRKSQSEIDIIIDLTKDIRETWIEAVLKSKMEARGQVQNAG